MNSVIPLPIPGAELPFGFGDREPAGHRHDYTLADGEDYVCVWNSPTAVAPEGIKFADVGSCDHVFTQAPSWFVHPERLYASDQALLEDTAFAEELLWAQGQVASSGCSCCHSSQSGSGHATAWDADAPAVWTDTISLARLYLLSGMIAEHKEFGVDPADNHGARRDVVMIPSSDPERLRAFLVRVRATRRYRRR